MVVLSSMAIEPALIYRIGALADPEEEYDANAISIIHGMRNHAAKDGRYSRDSPHLLPNGGRYSEATGRISGPNVCEVDLQELDGDDKSLYQDISNSSAAGVFEEQESWKVDNPKPQPLTYYIPTASSEPEQRTVRTQVDSTRRKSVAAANKARRLAVWRRKNELGMALMRPGTGDRKYSKDENDYIVALHMEHADQTGGCQVPYAALTQQFNKEFPGRKRTQASLTSHISRVKELMQLREQYER